MAFPADRLPVTVEIAPGANPAGDPASWSWVDITSSVRLKDRIRITQGRADESARVAPSTCRLRLDNRTGDFTPRNPLGAYYGSLGRNTPLRVRLQWANDTFTRTVSNGWGTADSGHVWTTTGGAASDYSATGSRGRQTHTATGSLHHSLIDVGRTNVDVQADVTIALGLAAGAPVTTWVAGRLADTANYYAAQLQLAVGSAMSLVLVKRVGGSISGISSSVAVGTHTGGATWRVRLRCVGSTLQAKAWPTSGSEPSAWQVQATATAPAAGTQVGVLSRFEVGNTNTLPQNIDWDNLTVTNDRFSGFVSSWPPRWDKSGRDATVPIEANGVLRRLGQGTPPEQSPMRRAVIASDPVAYWPVEDGGDTTQVASAISGHPPMTVSGDVPFEQANWESPGGNSELGTLPVADLKNGGSLVVSIPADATSAMATAWAIQCLKGSDILDTASADLVLLEWTTPASSFVRWKVVLTQFNETQVIAYNSAGTPTTVINNVGGETNPVNLRVTAEQSGGTINVALYKLLSDIATATGAVAGTLSGPTTVQVNATGVTNTEGWPFGHLALWATATPDFQLGAITNSYGRLVLSPHFGSERETAHDRLTRLCAEEGISLTMPAVSADFTTRMGAQPPGTFTDLADESVEADQGVLSESGFGLGFVSREARYNRAVALALDFDSGQVAEPPEPVDDDQRLRNRVIVRRTGGSSAIAGDADSIATHGLYQDEVTVNHVDDTALADHAAWRLHVGTTDEMRWPRVDLNLAAAPELIGDWLACGVQSRVTATNPPPEVAGDDIDVIIEGYSETLGFKDWDASLNCSPAQPWDVGVFGTSLYDTAGSQLAAQFISGTNTSMSVATTAGGVWKTGAVNFDLECGGARLTVTNISGASSPQTFTITQTPVNGISKTIPAGTAVRLWHPAVYAL